MILSPSLLLPLPRIFLSNGPLRLPYLSGQYFKLFLSIFLIKLTKNK